jgi:hypothetical protein
MSKRFLIYDGHWKASEAPLRSAWATGARLYRALGHVDAFLGAKSWHEALEWLPRAAGDAPISEIQFWGHGKWGEALIGDDRLSVRSFDPHRPLAPLLARLKSLLLPSGESLVWFRTCESFGALAGHAFAECVAAELATRAAGHTYVIGAVQSGLHGLRLGARPHWSREEGLAEGPPEAPRRAHPSSSRAPNTIHFLKSVVPPRWFEE